MSEIVEISALNKRGEGVAQASTGPITVPFTLPGEKVEVELVPTKDKTWGQIVAVVEPSASRALPICPHYGVCGGCSLQHLDEQTYAAFKQNQVTAPLTVKGFDAAIVEAPVFIPPISGGVSIF